MVTIQFLGSGDAFGSGGRFQACISLRTKRAHILLDCGASSLVAMKRLGIDPGSVEVVLLSHLHGDHFDRLAERKLNKATPIVSTRHATSYLEKVGFTQTRALKTWEPLDVEKGGANLRLTALPGTHGPGPLGAVLPPVMGSMLEFGSGDEVTYRLYITGDTLLHKALREIPRRYPDIDLALVHLGGTKILGVLVTMDARQGIEALRITRPRTAVPIHYNDYTVFKSPLEDFQRAVAAQELDSGVAYLSHGETYEFTVSR